MACRNTEKEPQPKAVYYYVCDGPFVILGPFDTEREADAARTCAQDHVVAFEKLLSDAPIRF